MGLYIKDGIIYDTHKGISHNGYRIFNANDVDMIEWGYEKYTPPTNDVDDNVNDEAYNIELEIEDLKKQLQKTDYIPLKAIEGYDCDTIYPGWKEERKEIRDRINELEAQLAEL